MLVIVIVLDVNDNLFVFIRVFYRMVVLEDIFVGVEFLYVEVFDVDLGFYGFVRFIFSLGDFLGFFELDESLGVLRLIRFLDCEI